MKFLPTFLLLLGSLAANALVETSAGLVAAVTVATPGTTVELAPGVFELAGPLVLPAGITLKGAGNDKTTITHSSGWNGNPLSLPDPETNFRNFDDSGYLIQLTSKADDITISDLKLTGPQLHGAIYGWENGNLHLHHLRIEDFLYTGVRTYQTHDSKIHDCEFVNTGQRWKRGKPGLDGGITGGGIFVIWMKDSEIAHNRFVDTREAPNLHYYGIKGRQGKRIRIHHNTIETNFSIEFPFENDEDVEIDHNLLMGTVSIPKHGGGPVPRSGVTFHIHHNYFRSSYSIEFPRNGIEIDHNLFDFDLTKDGGNLISGFGGSPSGGPAGFHNNLVSNPGRGVIWVEAPFSGWEIRNNHIIARTTATPREEGLFGFNPKSDFSNCRFRDNIVECIGTARPLFRNDESGKTHLSGNQLINIPDTHRHENLPGKGKAGLEAPLKFRCGVHDEFQIDGWSKSPISP